MQADLAALLQHHAIGTSAYSVGTLVLNFTKPHRGDWRDRRLLSPNTLEMSCRDPLTKINLSHAPASAPRKGAGP